jgi:CRP-like cAMP-binding protein
MPLHDTQFEALTQSPLFSSLSREQLLQLQPHLSDRGLGQGEHLFLEGQPAESFYLLLKGQIKLYRVSATGGEKVIEIVRPGQTFAEALMFLDRPAYPLTAQTLSAVELVVINSKGFQQLLADSTETCFRVMANISIRLRQLLNEIDALTLQNATLRVVNYLLHLIPEGVRGETGITLPASKNVIASRLSIQPETLSRIFSVLSSNRLISVDGLTIQIHDIEALRAFEV